MPEKNKFYYPDGMSMPQMLDLHPDDWRLRLIYADWLYDQGMGDQSRLQFWMVENQKAPVRRYEGTIFDWWPLPHEEDEDYGGGVIPAPSQIKWFKNCMDAGTYANRQDAEMDLLRILKQEKIL